MCNNCEVDSPNWAYQHATIDPTPGFLYWSGKEAILFEQRSGCRVCFERDHAIVFLW